MDERCSTNRQTSTVVYREEGHTGWKHFRSVYCCLVMTAMHNGVRLFPKKEHFCFQKFAFSSIFLKNSYCDDMKNQKNVFSILWKSKDIELFPLFLLENSSPPLCQQTSYNDTSIYSSHLHCLKNTQKDSTQHVSSRLLRNCHLQVILLYNDYIFRTSEKENI